MSNLTFFKRNGTKFERVTLPGDAVALILIDVWDSHPCTLMATRTEILAKKINQLLPAIRLNGVRIIHSPSGCEASFYLSDPRRMAFLSAPQSLLPQPSHETMMMLPRDNQPELAPLAIGALKPAGFDHTTLDQDGCDGERTGPGWRRQNAAIEIRDADIVAFEDESFRILRFLRGRNIRHLVYAGVATNECVLWTRNTSIFNMQRLIATTASPSPPDVTCYLARDLTDTMYDPPPKDPKYQDPRYQDHECHDSGTVGTVHWIETHLPTPVSTILSADLAVAVP